MFVTSLATMGYLKLGIKNEEWHMYVSEKYLRSDQNILM